MFVLGCDVSTKSIALADSEGNSGHILVSQLDRGSQRLADIHHRTVVYTRQFLDGRVPEVAFVEQPSGRFVHPNLWMAYGVVRAAMWEAMKQIAAHPVSVLAVSVGEWKQRAVGKGSASKEDVARWAWTVGQPSTQDEADALGVAFAGLSMIRGEEAA